MSRGRLGVALPALDWSGIGVALLAGVATSGVAAGRGGYFPESWAWLALLTFVPAAVLLVATERARPGRFELALLGVLTAYGGWVLASALWSVSVTQTVFEAQRMLAYVGVVLLGVLLVGRRTVRYVTAGALAGVAVVSAYAFLTRVLPDRFSDFDSTGGYRLTDPIGYWNGLGIFAAMGVLLALGHAARGRHGLSSGLAAALPPVLLSTLFFTFSRGAWAALAVGLAVAVLLDRRRLQLLTTALVLAPWSALAVWLCTRSDALTTVGSDLGDATTEGRSLLLWIALLTALSGLSGAVLAEVDRRIEVGAAARHAFAAVLVAMALGAVGVAWAEVGSPVSAASSAWDEFRSPYRVNVGELTGRLSDLSSGGRVDLWERSVDDFADRPVLGTGAGTFAYSWAAERDVPSTVRDGHSLYLETLGELGLVGLLLLVCALAVPFVATPQARASSAFPGAIGALAAYVAHAGVDWDWELAGVTVVALLCAVALVVAARRDEDADLGRTPTWALFAGAAALAAVSLATVLGNVPLGQARDALHAASYDEAIEKARAARTWAPWSSEPLRILGEAQLNAGRQARARVTILEAIEKDRENWELWLDLALVTRGAERRAAITTASRLNPLSPLVQQLVATL